MLRTLAVALALCAACTPAQAAPFGASDTAFSGDGWLTLSGGHDAEGQANAVELQPDRKIVSGGSAVVGGLTHFALTRHTPANGIDTMFGEQGKVVTPIGNSGNASIVDLEVLPGGAILALGNARQENEPRIALARYTAGGVLDGGFGNGGKVGDDLLADGARRRHWRGRRTGRSSSPARSSTARPARSSCAGSARTVRLSCCAPTRSAPAAAPPPGGSRRGRTARS